MENHRIWYASASVPPYGRVAQVIAAPKPHLRGQRGPNALRPLPGALTADQLRRRESACKQIVGSRFKRTGCRWSKADANALLAVKCRLKNNRWPRLPRMEGLPRCSRLTQKYEPHPLAKPLIDIPVQICRTTRQATTGKTADRG